MLPAYVVVASFDKYECNALAMHYILNHAPEKADATRLKYINSSYKYIHSSMVRDASTPITGEM